MSTEKLDTERLSELLNKCSNPDESQDDLIGGDETELSYEEYVELQKLLKLRKQLRYSTNVEDNETTVKLY